MTFNCNKVYFNNKRSSSNVIRKVQENKYLVRGNYCCKYKAFVNINVCYFKKFHIQVLLCFCGQGNVLVDKYIEIKVIVIFISVGFQHTGIKRNILTKFHLAKRNPGGCCIFKLIKKYLKLLNRSYLFNPMFCLSKMYCSSNQ